MEIKHGCESVCEFYSYFAVVRMEANLGELSVHLFGTHNLQAVSLRPLVHTSWVIKADSGAAEAATGPLRRSTELHAAAAARGGSTNNQVT